MTWLMVCQYCDTDKRGRILISSVVGYLFGNGDLQSFCIINLYFISLVVALVEVFFLSSIKPPEVCYSIHQDFIFVSRQNQIYLPQLTFLTALLCPRSLALGHRSRILLLGLSRPYCDGKLHIFLPGPGKGWRRKCCNWVDCVCLAAKHL